MRAGPPIADLIAGLQGALGVCAALVRRGRTGRGDTVGASLNNAMVSVLGFLAANYFATGEAPDRSGNDHAIVSPYGMFAPPMARSPSPRRRSNPTTASSTRWARPNCATTPFSAPTICASATARR